MSHLSSTYDMAQKNQPNLNAALIVIPNQHGLLSELNRFLRKLAAGVWSISQLNKERQSALQNWHKACLYTDAAIIKKVRAEWKLKQFQNWLQNLAPAYRNRYRIPLHIRHLRIENAARLALAYLAAQNRLEQRWINRLIALERVKSALTLNKTKKY